MKVRWSSVNRRQRVLAVSRVVWLLAAAMVGSAGALAGATAVPPAPLPPAVQSPAPASPAVQVTTLPYTPLPGFGMPLVRVRLNGKVDATLLLDTGTTFTFVSETVASQLGLTPQPATQSDGQPLKVFGDSVKFVSIRDFQVGNISLNIPTVILSAKQMSGVFGLMPNHAAQNVDGVLGLNVLEHCAIGLDMMRHMVTLWMPGGLTADQVQAAGFAGSGATSLPMTPPPNNGPYSVSVSFSNDAASGTTDLVIDTGSNVTVIPRLLAQSLGLKPTSLGKSNGPEMKLVSEVARVQKMQLGSLSLPNAKVWYPREGEEHWVLGLDALAGYRVLLDFPAGKMYLAPDAPTPTVPAPATTTPTQPAAPASPK